LVERLARRSTAEWFSALIEVGVPCGPINTVDQGIAFAREVGLDPVAMAGTGEAAVPVMAHPLRFSATPPRYDLPPPRLNEHGAEIRAWLAGGSGGSSPQASTADSHEETAGVPV
jgi:crotonobetainyl-CoA:carnitine CoA-transferase CaiB-like acyl-CoA transferase